MKRYAATVLAILFAGLLLLPFVSAGEVSNLPACCRKSGQHHCTLGDSGKSGFHAVQDKCPYSGLAPASAFQPDYLAASEIAVNSVAEHAADLLSRTSAGYRPVFEYIHNKRGPPALLLS